MPPLASCADDRHLAAPRPCAGRSAGTANRSPRAPRAVIGSMIAITCIETLQHAQQRRVELARSVIVGRARELVVETEGDRGTLAASRCCARRTSELIGQRIGNTRLSGLPRSEPASPWTARCPAPSAGHPCRPKTQQPRRDLVPRQHPKGGAHHGGARDLAEGADMRQARRTVAGLEQHLVLPDFLKPRDNPLACSNGQALDCSASVRRSLGLKARSIEDIY